MYRISAEVDSLEVFLRPDPDHFSGANGIVLAPGDRTLYVAFLEGIARLDVRTRRLARLRAASNTSTAGIDGLYWYRGALLGVQNAPGLERVVRFPGTAAGRLLNARPVAFVGVLSYSLYLWQQPFLNRHSGSWISSFPVNLALHPSGKWLAALHAGYGPHEIVVIELGAKKEVVRSRVVLEQAFYGLQPTAKLRFC